jgi:hypothetical protein
MYQRAGTNVAFETGRRAPRSISAWLPRQQCVAMRHAKAGARPLFGPGFGARNERGTGLFLPISADHSDPLNLVHISRSVITVIATVIYKHMIYIVIMTVMTVFH